MRLSSIAALLVCSTLAACAHRAPAFPAETAPIELLAPEGAESLVFIDLAAMRASPALSGTVDALLGEEGQRILEAWLRTTLARIDRLVVVRHDRGYVVVVEGRSLDARRIVRDAAVQMGQVEISDDRPFPRRAGRLGVERRELVALSATRLAIGGEDGAAMIALLDCARGRVPPALESADGRALRTRLGEATLFVASLKPLTLPWEADVAVLLARHRMLGASLSPSADGDWLTLRVGIEGELPPGAPENLRLLAEFVASSSIGGLLGMREGDEALRVSAADSGATIVHRIASERLTTALREVFRAELGEIGEGLGGPP